MIDFFLFLQEMENLKKALAEKEAALGSLTQQMTLRNTSQLQKAKEKYETEKVQSTLITQYTLHTEYA